MYEKSGIQIYLNSIFIGPESDHWLCLSLTNWLTHCRLVNLIGVTLACEDTYSKLVEVVIVADISDEDRVGNSFFWRFGSWGLVIKLNFCSDCEHFGQVFEFEVEARLWSWSLVSILAADVWLRLRSWILVNILRVGLVKIFTLDLAERLMFGWDFEVNA